MDTIGSRLKEERERLALSQTAFGDLGGIKKLAQINYEKNGRSPDAVYLAAIANAGADVWYILTGERLENTASTPIELSYLRICRALPDNVARMAGNAALMGVMSSYGIQLNTDQTTNKQDTKIAAQGLKTYGDEK